MSDFNVEPRPVPNADNSQHMSQVPNADISSASYLRQTQSSADPEVQPTQVQPTQVQPAVQSTQVQPTVQQPFVSQTQSAASYARQAYSAGEASTTQASQPRFTQNSRDKVRVVKAKRSIGVGGAFLLSLFTALLGAGILYSALMFTGQVAMPAPLAQLFGQTTTVEGSEEVTTTSAGPTVTINALSEDATVAQAVAAKALPSVVSFYVVGSEGGGVGSGVILDTAGNILTNYHVIEGASSIVVTIEGESYTAEVVGQDESSDLAVVKADLNGASVVPIEIGDSSKLVVGDWVMTIGSPYGLDQSVSAGIVSSLYRSTMMSSYSGNTLYTNLIQTDAAINPGNSGGALVNNEGKLVGINSLNASMSGGSSGVGFAIPVNYAIRVANTILSGERVLHAYIGLSLQTVTAQNAQSAGLSVNQGAYVGRVTPGSPADEAGIQAGDVIVKVGRDKIASADALILAIRSHDVGEEVVVTAVRGDETLEFDVTLGSDEVLQGAGSEEDQSEDNREEYGNDWRGR